MSTSWGALEHRGPVSLHEHSGLEAFDRMARPSRNISRAFDVRGPLDISALQRAADHLVQRHEALRTRFVRDGDGWIREVYTRARGLTVVDLRDAPDPPAAAEARLRKEAATAHALDVVPLTTFTAARIGETRWLVQAVVDHLVGDLASAMVLCRELGRAYRAFAATDAQHLPDTLLPPTVQAREVAAQRHALLAPILAGWEAGEPVFPPNGTTLEPDGCRPEGLSPDAGLVLRPLPSSGALQAACRAAGVSKTAAYVAALTEALRARTGQVDTGMSLVRHGRPTPEAWRALGFLVHTDSYVSSLPLDAPWPDRLAEAHAFVEDDAPWRLARNLVAAPPTRRVMLKTGAAVPLRLTGTTCTPRPDLQPVPDLYDKHDVVVVVDGMGAATRLLVVYRLCRFRRATLEAVAEDFVGALQRMLSPPSST